eukprot:gene21336-27642_t
MDGYRDLLLADNFLYMMKKAEKVVMDTENRNLYRKLTEKAICLIAEVGALMQTESVRHLETIQDICEDELKFLERMEYLKPRFDTSLLAYLNFAIAEEELKMKTQQQSSDWLQSLPNSDATILAMKSLKKDVDSEVETQGQQLELRHRNPVLQSEIETMQELKRRSDRAGGLDTSADFLGGPSR